MLRDGRHEPTWTVTACKEKFVFSPATFYLIDYIEVSQHTSKIKAVTCKSVDVQRVEQFLANTQVQAIYS